MKKIGIIMGSESDLPVMNEASKFLELKRTQGGKSAYQYAQDLITGT